MPPKKRASVGASPARNSRRSKKVEEESAEEEEEEMKTPTPKRGKVTRKKKSPATGEKKKATPAKKTPGSTPKRGGKSGKVCLHIEPRGAHLLCTPLAKTVCQTGLFLVACIASPRTVCRSLNPSSKGQTRTRTQRMRPQWEALHGVCDPDLAALLVLLSVCWVPYSRPGNSCSQCCCNC